jgi:hypothetical protein
MTASDSEVLMVFGGENENTALTSLLIFNPRSNCWMELTTKLPIGLY